MCVQEAAGKRRKLFKYPEAFFQGFVFARGGHLGGFSEGHLGYQPPGLGQLPGCRHFIVYQWVVVLERGPEAGIFEHGPHGELVHCRGLLGPVRKFVPIQGEGFLQVFHHCLVFVKENGAVAGKE